MLRYSCIFVLATVFQVIAAQEPPGPPPFFKNVPEKCRGPPRDVNKPHECCKIPPFFTEEDFAECGFKKPEESGEKRHGPPDCSKQLCMLKKYKLLQEDETINNEAVGEFMDKWGESNAEFQQVATQAKERCVGKELPGPPQICDANKLVFCVSSTLFSECPVWDPSDGCQKLKEHLDECKQYFPK